AACGLAGKGSAANGATLRLSDCHAGAGVLGGPNPVQMLQVTALMVIGQAEDGDGQTHQEGADQEDSNGDEGHVHLPEVNPLGLIAGLVRVHLIPSAHANGCKAQAQEGPRRNNCPTQCTHKLLLRNSSWQGNSPRSI